MYKLFKKGILQTLLFTLTITYFPAVVFSASDTLNAGFVSGLWFSKSPFFTGDTVRIYTAFQNQSGTDITGKVEFLDGSNIIATRDFSATNGQLIQTWCDWNVLCGNHSISVRLTNVLSSKVGEDPKPVTLSNNTEQSATIFADTDTDKDGIGDKVDTDDDNDGISDKQEIQNGTDPLKSDTDGDGIPDNTDPHPLVKDTVDPLKTVKDYMSPLFNSEVTEATSTGVLEKISDFRESLKDSLIKTKIDVETKLKTEEEKQKVLKAEQVKVRGQDSSNTTSNSSDWTNEMILDHIKKFLLSIAIFLLSYSAGFYLTIFLIMYLLWRFLVRRRR